MQKRDRNFMWPGTWERRESNVLTHVKAKNVLFRRFKGSHGMWSINDLPEKTEKSTFSGGGYFLLFWCHCKWAYYVDHQNITSCRKNPWEIPQAFPDCALLHINQSWARNKRKELGGEKSWKPLVFSQSVNRPLESEDQTRWIAHWRWSSLHVRLKMKNASMRKDISIKQVVALDLKTSPLFPRTCSGLYNSFCPLFVNKHICLRRTSSIC